MNYQIHTSATTVFDADLDVTQPVRLLIAELVAQAGLPTCDRQGFPVAYALFAGDERRRLSSEQTLDQARYASGGDLYLAPADAPWWARTFVGRKPAAPAAPATVPGSAPRPATGSRRTSTATITGSLAPSRWPISPAALAIVAIGLIAVILLWIFFTGDGNASETSPGNGLTFATPTTMANEPTATLVAGMPAPTSTPAPVPVKVNTVEPNTVTITDELFQLTLTGSDFTEVEQVVLMPEQTDHAPVSMTFEVQSPTDMIVRPAEQVSPPGGPVVYTLVVNNQAAGSVTLQDFIRSVQAQGILRTYLNRNPALFFDGRSGFGAFLWAEAEQQNRVPATEGHVVISNGDTLEILDESVAGMYRVRVRSNTLDSADPQVIGTTGWIVRWLIDNQGIPQAPAPAVAPGPGQAPGQAPAQPQPGPMVFSGSLFEQPTDGSVQCGTAFESGVWGTVYGRGGGIAGAVVQATSADGGNSFSGVTNGQGNFSIGGLGCTTWFVQVVSVPGGNVQSQAVSVNLNGGRYSGAGIDFYMQ